MVTEKDKLDRIMMKLKTQHQKAIGNRLGKGNFIRLVRKANDRIDTVDFILIKQAETLDKDMFAKKYSHYTTSGLLDTPSITHMNRHYAELEIEDQYKKLLGYVDIETA